jgi:hypothetical protein
VAWAEWSGHTFFGSLHAPPHRPNANDDTAGTAGEFGMGPHTDNPPPIGYEDAAPGEPFLKIGVGRLARVEEPLYNFGALYRIIQPASWEIHHGERSIRFLSEDGPVRGHAYRYTKTVELSDSAPTFSVRHTLENTGSTAIAQTHYCHNFLRIDDTPIGSAYSIELPFTPKLSNASGDILEPRGKSIGLSRQPGPGEGFIARIEGHDVDAGHNQLLVRCGAASLRITGSEPMRFLQVFGTDRTICPEPFVRIELAPGAGMTWTIKYDLLESERVEILEQ